MAHFSRGQQGVKEGKITYNKSIVRNIVTLAISEIEDVSLSSSKDAIKITHTSDSIDVQANVIINKEHCVTDIAFKIQENIKRNVETMSEYKIGKIDVNITDVVLDEETTEQKN